MRVATLLEEGVARLVPHEGLPDPRREARWLLARLLGRSEAWVLAHGDEEVGRVDADLWRAWIVRRAAGEPAHYIVGECEFYNRSFVVSPAVLIPRPETELLVDGALSLVPTRDAAILDVGTGSGCVAITLALELPDARLVATDVSLEASAVARINARRLGARTAVLVGDLASHVRGGFDLVVANLPYVPDEDLADLPLEVRGHEPHVALLGGPGGHHIAERLVDDLPRLLRAGGHALLERGPRQANALVERAASIGLVEWKRNRDLAGFERVLVLSRPS